MDLPQISLLRSQVHRSGGEGISASNNIWCKRTSGKALCETTLVNFLIHNAEGSKIAEAQK